MFQQRASNVPRSWANRQGTQNHSRIPNIKGGKAKNARCPLWALEEAVHVVTRAESLVSG